ncbi:MAG TPA: 2-succinyl-5-enolpyruvyl-6-hydroxy-3-cyclohexene-1-carboxylic-acid synthase [Candidatus Acidoferrales bacterium]|nr:2-succinyl-5-enolpyruvyl-6-hydroxy-3-cyclohexene-1-carboxylic-acid synthase [Candidatus Acidoferrales bacterium]
MGGLNDIGRGAPGSQITHRFAATFVDELARCGLVAACIAPGSRSAPLAMAFARHQAIRVYMHVDERSAAFFGLGLAKATERPVALLCTSGTAAAEFHPAVIEAFHSRTPLLVLTADRPPELREVGANQAIDQGRLYGAAVRWYFDPGPPDEEPGCASRWRRLASRSLQEAGGPPAGPVHLNLPFREPLTPEVGEVVSPDPTALPPLLVERGSTAPSERAVQVLAEALSRSHRPLLVAGEMRDGARLADPAGALARSARLPILAEPTSNLRRSGTSGLVEAYDPLLREPEWAAAHQPDLVVRLGGPPTSKPLSELIATSGAVQIVLDPEGWRDPSQSAAAFLRGDPEALLSLAAGRIQGGDARAEWVQSWRDGGAMAAAAVGRALDRAPLHEGHVVRALAATMPGQSTLMVGSSMAVRDLDSFWPPSRPGPRILANRGASGIDGVVSTGLGALAASAGPGVILIGDLSLYHDMNGLWSLGRHGLNSTIVVLDNNGGGIFEYLAPAQHPDVFEEVFATPLGLRMEDVATLYGLDFQLVTQTSEIVRALAESVASPRPTLLCARFSRADSVRGHRACWAAVSEAML